jgi:hypothetical protein
MDMGVIGAHPAAGGLWCSTTARRRAADGYSYHDGDVLRGETPVFGGLEHRPKVVILG